MSSHTAGDLDACGESAGMRSFNTAPLSASIRLRGLLVRASQQPGPPAPGRGRCGASLPRAAAAWLVGASGPRSQPTAGTESSTHTER